MDHFETISLDGYEIVSENLFRNEKAPTMTIFKEQISFSREAHTELKNCAGVQILINYTEMSVIVRPSMHLDSDSTINWNRSYSDGYIPRFTCPKLTRPIYSTWKWDENKRYKTDGRIVRCKKEIMLLFDFKNAASYLVKDPKGGNG